VLDTLQPASPFAGFPLVGRALRVAPVDGLVWRRFTTRNAGLPARPGATAIGDVTVLWIGPHRYWAYSENPQADFAAIAGADADVTDFTGARATVEITGPAARRVLAKLVPIDVDPSVFGPGAAGATLCGHIDVMLWNTDAAYRLSCSRSFARSLWTQIAHAAAEFVSIHR
jgi:heterotetrameric sarcosine oxidase gamma subunit